MAQCLIDHIPGSARSRTCPHCGPRFHGRSSGATKNLLSRVPSLPRSVRGLTFEEIKDEPEVVKYLEVLEKAESVRSKVSARYAHGHVGDDGVMTYERDAVKESREVEEELSKSGTGINLRIVELQGSMVANALGDEALDVVSRHLVEEAKQREKARQREIRDSEARDQMNSMY